MKKNLPIILAGVGAVALFFILKNKKATQQKSAGTYTPTPPKQRTKAGQILESLFKSAPDIYASTGTRADRRQAEQNKNNPYVTAPSKANAPSSNLPSWM